MVSIRPFVWETGLGQGRAFRSWVVARAYHSGFMVGDGDFCIVLERHDSGGSLSERDGLRGERGDEMMCRDDDGECRSKEWANVGNKAV